MPHCTIECSTNIRKRPETPEFFRKLHTVLSTIGPFQPDGIKSRILFCDQFLASMTNPDKGFVHMKLSLLEGRSEELKRIIKESVLSFLTEEFQELFSPVACSISIEIQDIPKGFYDQKEI